MITVRTAEQYVERQSKIIKEKHLQFEKDGPSEREVPSGNDGGDHSRSKRCSTNQPTTIYSLN